MHHALAFYTGYCAGCAQDRPLVLVEHGPRGARSWLAGSGAEDRTLSYCCRLCGRDEHVPLTEAEDAAYDATLMTWPDTFLVDVAAPTTAPWQAAQGDVFASAVLRLVTTLQPPAAIPAPRRPVVRVIHLASQRVGATDDHPLALAVA